MSYSRWSHSRFYAYWDACSGNTRDTQVLTVHPVEGPSRYIAYGDVVDVSTVHDVRRLWANDEEPDAGEEDWLDLLANIEVFREEVEDEYPDEEARG